MPPSISCATLSSPYQKTLPVELWLEVFSYATFVPGLLDVTDSRAIEAYSSDANGVAVDNSVTTALKTKRAISEVCWTWWRYIQPMLFEHIRIKSGAHAVQIADRLEASGEEEKVCHRGRWIKRVEIFTSDCYWDEERVEALIHILNKSPNLTVFSDLFCSSPSSILENNAVIETLASKCTLGNLRRLEWYSGSSDSLCRLLEQSKRLEVLVLGRGCLANSYSDPITLPNLTTLITSEYATPSRFKDIQLPSIKSLIIHGTVIPASKFDVRDYFSLEGDIQRMRLQLDDWRSNYVNLCAFKELRTLALDFGRRYSGANCKKLQHGTVEEIDFVNFPLFRFVNIWESRRSPESRKGLEELMYGILEKDALPVLKRIGFYVPQSYPSWVESSVSKDFWKPWIEACAARGINVEISVGESAHIRNSWKPFDMYKTLSE